MFLSLTPTNGKEGELNPRKAISREADGRYRIDYDLNSEYAEIIQQNENIEGGESDFEQDWDDDSYEDRMKE